MANAPLKPEEQKKLLLKAKKQPINFCFAPDPKTEDLMMLDKRKPSGALFREVTKDRNTAKLPKIKMAHGVFNITGRVLKVTSAREMPGFAKKLRLYLKTLRIKLNIEIWDENNQLLESDQTPDAIDYDEDGNEVSGDARANDTDTAAQDPARDNAQLDANDDSNDAPVEKDTQRAEFAERLRSLQGPIAALGSTGKTLSKAAAAVIALMKAGQLEKANTMLSALEGGLQKAQAATQDAAAESAPAKGADAKAIIGRATALKQALAEVQDADTGPLRKQLANALRALNAGDTATSDAALASAEQGLADLNEAAQPEPQAEEPALEQEAAPEPDQENPTDVEAEAEAETADPFEDQALTDWRATEADLQSKVDKAAADGHENSDDIKTAFAYAQSQGEAGAYDLAQQAAARTEQLIAPATTATAAAADDASPDQEEPTADVALIKSRLSWSKTRSGLQADLVKLKMAIDAQTSGVEGLEEISSQTDVLLDYIEELDLALEDALDDIVTTPDGDARSAIKDDAIKIINTYRDTLDTDFFKAVDQNGFANTNIRATALNALRDVETNLAA